jgi:hypothetical protein
VTAVVFLKIYVASALTERRYRSFAEVSICSTILDRTGVFGFNQPDSKSP